MSKHQPNIAKVQKAIKATMVTIPVYITVGDDYHNGELLPFPRFVSLDVDTAKENMDADMRVEEYRITTDKCASERGFTNPELVHLNAPSDNLITIRFTDNHGVCFEERATFVTEVADAYSEW